MKSFYLEEGMSLFQNMWPAVSMRPLRLIPSQVETQEFSFDTSMSNGSISLDDIRAAAAPLAQPLREAQESFTRTYTSFSGSDAVISFNDEIYGEVESLSYKRISNEIAHAIAEHSNYYDRHMVVERPVVVVITNTVFDREMIIPEGANCTITFANEYGQSATYSIMDLKFISEISGVNVDSVILQKTRIFAAKEVTALS